MKTFVLILMGLGVMILLASCGLIRTSSVDKKLEKIADEYGGVYVFDKKFREEIIQREKERKVLYLQQMEKFKVGEADLKSGEKVVYVDPSIEKELPPPSPL